MEEIKYESGVIVSRLPSKWLLILWKDQSVDIIKVIEMLMNFCKFSHDEAFQAVKTSYADGSVIIAQGSHSLMGKLSKILRIKGIYSTPVLMSSSLN